MLTRSQTDQRRRSVPLPRSLGGGWPRGSTAETGGDAFDLPVLSSAEALGWERDDRMDRGVQAPADFASAPSLAVTAEGLAMLPLDEAGFHLDTTGKRPEFPSSAPTFVARGPDQSDKSPNAAACILDVPLQSHSVVGMLVVAFVTGMTRRQMTPKRITSWHDIRRALRVPLLNRPDPWGWPPPDLQATFPHPSVSRSYLRSCTGAVGTREAQVNGSMRR